MGAPDLNNISVSVVIPVYNAEKYLRETLDYVCNQTLRDIEIICVDDGSTDDSLGILQEYAARDGRFRILQQQNQYAGVARNNGMAAARGKYMVFWDSDDIFLPEMLEKLYNRAEETGADLVCCDGMEYDEDKRELHPAPWILPGLQTEGVDTRAFNPLREAPDEVFDYSGSAPWNKLYRREFIEQNHITWLETQSSNDLTFVCHCMALAGKVSLLKEVLIHYRVRHDSIWHSKAKSPRNMYEAHAELLRRMEALNMPERVLTHVCGHLLAEMNPHLSADSSDNPAERAAIYRDEYEPLFRMMARDMGEYRRCHIYNHLKAFIAPDATVVVPLEHYAEHLDECLTSLFPYAARILIDVSRGDAAAAAQAEEMANRYFWVVAIRGEQSEQATATATLAPDRIVTPHAHLGKMLKKTGAGGVLNLNKLCPRYAFNRLFYICTPQKRSWRLFGLPVVTFTYCAESYKLHVLGRLVKEWKN